MSEKYVELQIDNPNEAVMLLGMSDANITLIEETYSVQIITRGEVIQIAGDDLEKKNQAYAVLEALLKVIRKNINIDQRDVSTAIEMATKAQLNIMRSYMMKKLRVIQKVSQSVQKRLVNVNISGQSVIKT